VNDLIERVQDYLHHEYSDQEIEKFPRFNIYINLAGALPKYNLAAPVVRTAVTDDSLNQIEDTFWQRNLSPRVQFLDAYNPSLVALLGQNGYEMVLEEMVLTCTPESLRPAPEMPGLTTLVLSGDSSIEDIKEGIQQTSQLGFDPFASPVLNTNAELFRKTLVTGQRFVLRLNKNPVSAGMFMEIFDGLTRVAGLTTLVDYRRQGFAAYLTGYMTKYAFSRHVDTVFLKTPADGTENVYKRVGFKPCAALLTFEKAFH
jgi:GNAT superfamily N-acetyltransferase